MTQSYTPPPGLDALFDLTFTRFITISFIKVIYLLGMVGIGLGWLGLVFAGLSQGVVGLLIMVVVGTILSAIYLIFLRVSLEVIVVIFRIGENTTAIAAAQGGSQPTGGFPVTPIAPTS